jgi:peroxidase
MVTGKYDRLAPNFDLKSSVPLRDTFFKTKILYEEGAVDEVTRGLLQQRGKIVENSVTADLSQQLFHGTRSAFGFDLVSFNIQRGRDHGIHGYMQWRSYCRLPTATNFSQLKKLDAMPEDVVNRLASLYQ